MSVWRRILPGDGEFLLTLASGFGIEPAGLVRGCYAKRGAPSAPCPASLAFQRVQPQNTAHDSVPQAFHGATNEAFVQKAFRRVAIEHRHDWSPTAQQPLLKAQAQAEPTSPCGGASDPKTRRASEKRRVWANNDRLHDDRVRSSPSSWSTMVHLLYISGPLRGCPSHGRFKIVQAQMFQSNSCSVPRPPSKLPAPEAHADKSASHVRPESGPSVSRIHKELTECCPNSFALSDSDANSLGTKPSSMTWPRRSCKVAVSDGKFMQVCRICLVCLHEAK